MAAAHDPLAFDNLDTTQPFSILDRVSKGAQQAHCSENARKYPSGEQTNHAAVCDVLDRFASACSLSKRNAACSKTKPIVQTSESTPSQCHDQAGPSSVTLEDFDAKVFANRACEQSPLTWDQVSRKDSRSKEWKEQRLARRATDYNDHASHTPRSVAEALIIAGNDETDCLQQDAIELTYPSEDVLESLLQTASGFASSLFSWDQSQQRFRWATDLKRHSKRARATPALLPEEAELQSLLDEKASASVDTLSPPRIIACSRTSSESIVAPFLQAGTLLRRIEDRANFFKQSNRSGVELIALCSAIDTILVWLKTQLHDWKATLSEHCITDKTLLGASAELKQLLEILCHLAALLQCHKRLGKESIDIEANLDFDNDSSRLLSGVYARLEAAINQQDSPLTTGVLLYILDKLTKVWREKLTSWIGWPNTSSTSTQEELVAQLIQSIELEYHEKLKARRSKRHTYKPIDGIEVEWSFDERNELDIGYVLRSSQLPSFFPLDVARDILEGGRALQLLREATAGTHPMVCAQHHLDPQTIRLPIPAWTKQEPECEIMSLCAGAISSMRDAIRKWEDEGRNAHEEAKEQQKKDKAKLSLDTYARRVPNAKQGNTLETSMEESLSMYSRRPLQSHQDESNSSLNSRNDLEQSLASVCAESDDSDLGEKALRNLSQITHARILGPLVSWSRLASNSVIDVFVRDLHFVRYIDMCRDFFLLGHENFRSRVCSTLFPRDQSFGANAITAEKSANLSQFKSDGVWHIGDSGFAPTMNQLLHESIEEWRSVKPSRNSDEPESWTFWEEKRAAAEESISRRLSFGILPSSRKESLVELPRIDSFDWLTLILHPPPLIATVVTPDALLGYQTVFAFLLRLFRVDAILKGTFRILMLRRTSVETFLSYCDGEETSLALQFQHEARHFASSLLTYATRDAVEAPWKIFRSELDDLLGHSRGSGISTFVQRQHLKARMHNFARHDPSAHAKSKDVFGIASLHEDAIARMRKHLFLRSKQKAIADVLESIMNSCIAFQTWIQWRQDCIGAREAAPLMKAPSHVREILQNFRSEREVFTEALAFISGCETGLSFHKVQTGNATARQKQRVTELVHSSNAYTSHSDHEAFREKLRSLVCSLKGFHSLSSPRM